MYIKLLSDNEENKVAR